MRKFHPLILSLLTGLLLFAAWPMSPLTFLIFTAFVPLLWLEQQGIRRKSFFGWTYLSMLIWNVSTTWWVWNASEPGALGAFLANSLLMCLPWLGFHFVKKRMGPAVGYTALICLWLSFEYFHLHNWGLSWPWLTIGNVFATHPDWVQWYEYTGVSGGGLWIMSANVLIFRSLCAYYSRGAAAGRARAGSLRAGLVQIALVLIIPIILSYTIKSSQAAASNATSSGTAGGATANHQLPDIVIVQPNIDPYEKLYSGSFDAQLHKLIHISETYIDSNTVLVVWPETALYMENPINEENMKANYFLNPLWDFLRRHPRINLLTGIESYRMFKGKLTATAENIPGTDKYTDRYNAAVILDSTGPVQFYHKTMLVPGVETLPPFLHFLDSWFEKLGGTSSGYAGQKDRTVLSTSNHSYRIAPAVCYESIYGEFMSAYVHNGADLIAVITNDGWWGDTPGYHQHENYARLRAIETRRWVVRSANTGVSCVIDPLGNVIESRPWDQATAIRQTIPLSAAGRELTFYARYGDCISIAAVLLGTLFLLWNIVTVIKTRKRRG